MNVKTTFKAIRALGLKATRTDGEWCVDYRRGHEPLDRRCGGNAYHTTDNADAIGTARDMAARRETVRQERRAEAGIPAD
jgi:hypothetical protein